MTTTEYTEYTEVQVGRPLACQAVNLSSRANGPAGASSAAFLGGDKHGEDPFRVFRVFRGLVVVSPLARRPEP